MSEWTWVTTELPDVTRAPIKVQLDAYTRDVWLVEESDRIHALLDRCAHMGSSLVATSDGNLACPAHGWTFDAQGSSVTPPGFSLQKLETRVTGSGQIEIRVPLPDTSTPSQMRIGSDVLLRVHAHACVELDYQDISVVFDPWLAGAAFYGSWHLFPTPQIQPEELSPTVIAISHAHEDHLHEPTLSRIRKDLPVLVPNFPSSRIERRLASLGFSNIEVLAWDEPFLLSPAVAVTFIRPQSLWEDAAAYVTVQDESTDFAWLNQVDAGPTLHGFKERRVDVLSSAFGQGASGYPLTWRMSETRKRRMMESSKRQTLQTLPMRAQDVKASYFLPFASHWRLGLPEHQRFQNMIPDTTLEEVVAAFEAQAPEIEVLKLLPGESFSFMDNRVDVCENARAQLSDGFQTSETLEYDEAQVEFDRQKFDSSMHRLTMQSRHFGSEAVEFRVDAVDLGPIGSYWFGNHPAPNSIVVTVELPLRILRLLAEGSANWDDVAIGYWGVWSREPDRYPINFLRLLQAGEIYQYQDEIQPASLKGTLEASVGELIESNPAIIPRLLNRLGLPCASCGRANTESLRDALRLHAIDAGTNEWLLREIAASYGAGSEAN